MTKAIQPGRRKVSALGQTGILPVALHRLVFHGGECVLSEEV